MLGVDVLPADIQDRDGCLPVLKKVRRLFPFLEKIVADGGYRGVETAAAVRRAAGAPLEIVKRSDTAKGFVLLPKRWIVERTFGWLNRCRRLSKNDQPSMCWHCSYAEKTKRRQSRVWEVGRTMKMTTLVVAWRGAVLSSPSS